MDSAEKLEETGPAESDREEEDEHISQTAWTPTPPKPKGEGTEPSVQTTTTDVGKLRSKSAAASDRPGSELEQPSMKVVTVKFRGVQGRVDGHKISFSLGA